MKIIDQISGIFVGVLFIFSGLIKVNDPMGTAIKLEEYFDVFANNFAAFFHTLVPFALVFSVIFSVMEVVLGVALLLKFRMRFTAWFLLLLILFFSFLTFYSAYTNSVTDCGCFGDAIHLTPWQSFSKDLILLVLVIYLFIRRKNLDSVFRARVTDVVMGAVIFINLFLAVYAIEHLPFFDFRPYSIGSNIQSKMKPSAPYIYKYIMVKDGKTFEFNQYPTDTTYHFKEMILTNPEAQPKITDFSIWNDEGDFTDQVLAGVKLLVIFQDVKTANLKHLDQLKALILALSGDATTWIITANGEAAYDQFRHEHEIMAPYFFADGTVSESNDTGQSRHYTAQKWHCAGEMAL